MALSSCGMYVIHKSTPAGDHSGVPFFVKTTGCRHEVTRLEPYYVLTLTTKNEEKTESSETTTLSKSQFNSKPVLDLRSNSQIRHGWNRNPDVMGPGSGVAL